MPMCHILAEGAIALSVTLSGGALFASSKLFQFLSSLIVKVILAIFMGASAPHVDTHRGPYSHLSVLASLRFNHYIGG